MNEPDDRDKIRAELSPGEGVLVPEAVRALGGAPAISALNALYGGPEYPTPGQNTEMMRRLQDPGDDDLPGVLSPRRTPPSSGSGGASCLPPAPLAESPAP